MSVEGSRERKMRRWRHLWDLRMRKGKGRRRSGVEVCWYGTDGWRGRREEVGARTGPEMMTAAVERSGGSDASWTVPSREREVWM